MTVCLINLGRRRFSDDLAAALSSLIFLIAGLIGTATPTAATEESPTLIVTLVGGADSASVIARDGGAEVSQTPALYRHIVSVPAEELETVLARYQTDPLVAQVELDRSRPAKGDPDPFNSTQWPLPQMGWALVTLDLFGNTNPAVLAAAAYAPPDLTGTALAGASPFDGSAGAGAPGNDSVATPPLPAGEPSVGDGVAYEKAAQTITVTAAAPATAVYASTFDVAATASSNLVVTITTSGACTGSGNGSTTITMTSGTGICTVSFNQAGDANHNAAPEVTNATTATKADQRVALTAAYASTFTVAAAASSGLAVAITTSGVCTGSGSGAATIAMTSGTGHCTVHYNQAGDANYQAASEATNDTTAIKADQRITVTAAAPATAVYASTFDVTATASSKLAVAITVSGVCTGSGRGTATIAMTSGVGLCMLHFNQAGDDNFYAATQVTESVTAEQATLIVRPNPPTASRQYSDGNPSFVPSYSGFATGEGVSDLTEEPSCATTAGPTSTPGSYPIMCSGGSALNYAFGYADGATLTVTAEDALIGFGRDNPAAVKVTSHGRYTKKLSLTVLVKEKQPDTATKEAAAGDINSAALTVTLSPLLAGGIIRLTCTAAPVSVIGYDAVKTFTCTTDRDLGIDVYDLTAQVSGNYSGVAYDSISVYGRDMGFANGGGWFYWPGTADKTNFGFVMKSGKSDTDLRGTLLVVRHHADGTISRIKSHSLTGLVLQNDATAGCGNAIFSGNATHTVWNPSANTGRGGYMSTDDNQFMAYAEDCNNPGTGLDYFLVRSVGEFQMLTDVSVNKVPLAAERGDIVVPHGAGKRLPR